MADADHWPVEFESLLARRPAGGETWLAPAAPATDEPRLFGGLLIAQAIAAASLDTRRCHSLHAYYIGVGATAQPFAIASRSMRDGGSFATRCVEIRQGEKLLLSAMTSHHDGDGGSDRHAAMPDLPPAHRLEDQRETRRRRAEAAGKPWRRYLVEEVMDIRPVELPGDGGASIADRAAWFRPRRPLRDAAFLHRAATAFASDAGLVRVGLMAHARDAGEVQAASLDHAIWFHREADANGWMLHVQRGLNLAQGRGLADARIFSQDGTLVASVAQEFLARTKRPA